MNLSIPGLSPNELRLAAALLDGKPNMQTAKIFFEGLAVQRETNEQLRGMR